MWHDFGCPKMTAPFGVDLLNRATAKLKKGLENGL
jgi:hypothetical protein